MWVWRRSRLQLVGEIRLGNDEIICCSRAFFRYALGVGRSAPLLWRKFKRKFRSKKLVPESPQRKNTTRRRSTSSKFSKQFGNGRECLLEIRTNADCITWFTKFSITRSTNISQDFAQRSKWSSTSTDRSRCATTAAAFWSTFIRNGKCPRLSWC